MTATGTATVVGQDPVVGFIGLGDQGLPMATAAAEAGFALQAWARCPASLDGLSGVPHVRRPGWWRC
ncbi:NAD(P)-binding domain-containing protein [Streptacidiphilus sp. N1-12]|uniref:NAD(P)-binding domain-containing protein n=2 Tax=Streptacidiphilus alkalitolerans TaxID=3342712 RepID=A0ABV6WA39_9ACTN